MAWDVVFYEAADGALPAADFLDSCPAKVRGTILAVITGMRKAHRTVFSERDYAAVRRLGDEHAAMLPRRVAR
jgi:hypothetical protein